jgi:predicted RNA binding protein YcfA (HicA-like mRNA interferase family)
VPSSIPVVSGAKVVRELESAGFVVERIIGMTPDEFRALL